MITQEDKKKIRTIMIDSFRRINEILNKPEDPIIERDYKSIRDQIIENVCLILGVDKGLILIRCKTTEVKDARHICIFEMKKECPELKLAPMGKLFNRDHTTILSALNTYSDLYETDENFRNKANSIK